MLKEIAAKSCHLTFSSRNLHKEALGDIYLEQSERKDEVFGCKFHVNLCAFKYLLGVNVIWCEYDWQPATEHKGLYVWDVSHLQTAPAPLFLSRWWGFTGNLNKCLSCPLILVDQWCARRHGEEIEAKSSSAICIQNLQLSLWFNSVCRCIFHNYRLYLNPGQHRDVYVFFRVREYVFRMIGLPMGQLLLIYTGDQLNSQLHTSKSVLKTRICFWLYIGVHMIHDDFEAQVRHHSDTVNGLSWAASKTVTIRCNSLWASHSQCKLCFSFKVRETG